jgi:hydroxyethylthiazole kinase
MKAKQAQDLVEHAAGDLIKIRTDKPLIHHITNFVVMNETANATLCIGALPVMAHAKEEVEEMVAMAGALVLNIGTLTPELVDSMIIAGKRANELDIPVIFDPVGAGATSLRTEACKKIMSNVKLSVIRGNRAEIGILAGSGGTIRGVEAVGDSGDVQETAKAFASATGAIISVTGPTDIITNGIDTALVSNGHAMMGTVTGTGCISTTITASFTAIQPDAFVAAAGALVAYNIAGEIAALDNDGKPGSFHAALYDQLYKLTPEIIKEKARVELA